MKTCKKLFSLLLVAVMLVAAIPFAAMATPIGTAVPAGDPITVNVTGGNADGHFTYEAGLPENFDPALTEHLTNVLVYGNYDKYNANTVQVVSGSWDAPSKTLSISVENVYTVKISGDATATGANKLKSVAYADYGQLTTTLTNAGLSEYLNSDKWTIVQPIVKDDTNFTLTVPVKKVNAVPPTTEPTTPPTTEPTTPPTTGSTTTQKTVVLTVDGVTKTYTQVNYNGSVTPSATDVQAILGAVVATGANPNITLNNYNITSAELNNNTITIVLATKPYEGYTLNLTVNGSNNTSTVTTYKGVDSYSGDTSDVAKVLKTFKVTNYDLNNYNVTKNEYVANTKTFNIGLTAKPTAADKYTVICNVNGNQLSSKTNVSYVGSLESNAANAQAILTAANVTTSKAVDQYKNISISKSSNGVITVDLRDTASIKVYNNANTYTTVTMEVGRPYVNYLGTNIINNSTFGGITVKDNSGASRFYTASQVTGGTAVVNANDVEVTIQRNGDSCTLNFLRSDGTVLESRKLYAGDQIGTLPSYTVGGVPATWTYNGKPISATDVYNFKTTSVNIVPYFGGISDVYVDVYINGNVKTMQTRVKVTDLVQNGVLYLNTDVKSAIASALRNSSNKNLTYTAFFDASTWSDFIKTKNTSGAAEPYRVGDNSERQGAVYLYVMVNNATVKATDSTNPKTGDNVKLGVAAAILAVAVVGFGAVVVINKKKGVR